MKVFLSHSKSDKPHIRRIKSDLEAHHIKCWIDEEEIPFGGSITEYIEKGLSESDVIMVFLSKNSVLSRWLKVEWQTLFFKQINDNKIMVIPVLLEDCEIPMMLRSRKYVDFSIASEYETNLSRLLRQLKKKFSNVSDLSSNITIDSVYQHTIEIVEELKKESLSFPSIKKLKIIESLKKIPRSGKYVRLKSYKPPLSIRSIYDHIHSISHIADQFLPFIDHGLEDHEYSELGRLIAFHELNEVILGDIPIYTELSDRERHASRIYAEDRLRTVTPSKRERIANDLIWMFLSEKQRKSMEKVKSHLRNKKSKVYIIFKCFDNIDPIIATWRYLNVYRGKLGSSANKFLIDMKDFFENPDVRSFLKDNKVDTKLRDLVSFLQTRKNAKAYYKDSTYPQSLSPALSIPGENLKCAIEGIPLTGPYE